MGTPNILHSWLYNCKDSVLGRKTSHLIGRRDRFPTFKADGVWSWPLMSIRRQDSAQYFILTISPAFVALWLIKHGNKFAFLKFYQILYSERDRPDPNVASNPTVSGPPEAKWFKTPKTAVLKLSAQSTVWLLVITRTCRQKLQTSTRPHPALWSLGPRGLYLLRLHWPGYEADLSLHLA